MARVALQLLLCGLSIVLFVPLSASASGSIVPVRLELLSEPTLRLDRGEIREAPIRLQVRRQSDDEPLAGVRVEVFVDVMLCMPLMPCTQPNPHLHGTFFPVPGESSGRTIVTSDSQGVATTPAFQAGAVAGIYDIAMGAYLMLGQEYTSAGSSTPRVQVLQGGALAFPPDPSPANIPINSRVGMAFLLLLMMLGGGWFLRLR